MAYTVVVQARDGRWVFGDSTREAELRAMPKGTYRTAADASDAAGHAPRELTDAELGSVNGGAA